MHISCKRLAVILGLLLFVACGDETSAPRAQIVVALSADRTVSTTLARIEARIYDPDAKSGRPAHVERFRLRDDDPNPGTRTHLPFSFALTQGRASRVLLEIAGFAQLEAAAPAVIEQRHIVQYEPGETRQVSILLTAACLGRVQECQGLEQTCLSDPALPARASCTAVAVAPSRPIDPGRETFFQDETRDAAAALEETVDATATAPRADLDAAASPHDASTMDAAVLLDAGASEVDSKVESADARVEDTSLPEPPPEELPACPVANACPAAEYPCVRSDDAQGYSCRGQYAAWPMPDREQGAKVAPRYADGPYPGTVLDEVTGLLWQREAPASYRGCSGRVSGTPGDTCTLAEAQRYCAWLGIGDKRWRLPTKIELESLVDFTQPATTSTLDPNYFEARRNIWYWTSSPMRTLAGSGHFAVSFDTGLSNNFVAEAAHRVRCVTSHRNPNAPPARYTVDAAARTVRDRYTTLEWDMTTSGPVTSLEQAQEQCRARGASFRVPTYKELLTLMDLASNTTAIDRVFTTGSVFQFLFSSTKRVNVGNLVYMWAIGGPYSKEELDKDVARGESSFSLHVRCVR